LLPALDKTSVAMATAP